MPFKASLRISLEVSSTKKRSQDKVFLYSLNTPFHT
jgi:hypothetical protein